MASTIKDQCISLVVLFVLGALTSQAMSRSLQDASISEKHKQWMARYGRVYKDLEEEGQRLKIFKDNVEYTESSNKDANKHYKLAVNQFADLTNEEFKLRNTFKSRCCWAFSVVASMEGIVELTTGTLTSLSEQELVDCDTSGQEKGCNGGLMDSAFQFIIQNQGLTTEANYPYQGTQGTCNTNATANPAATITGYEDVPTNNETALLIAVANQPVSVAIDVGGSDFQFYSSSVLTGACGTTLDHGVAAVGYGIDINDGTNYWLVKNSWGTRWGEEGYIRMQRYIDAKEGLCGIAMQPSYPTA
ncbi:hypothetical protein RHGRI_017573 [Rhododendron griersonianum]|uniref:Uncharacterized protein n=1 Tax=Rhododendron griersonianum TaxID=479676 RepID=A0AAV6JYC8_9ERIC|nr:hypothetical protein RHGRI_017569 [Rhododendron griersonianum]KAG5545145.1 hypothetical protein RHGRI_017573 [Rhododendron griersonianum]